MMNNWILPDINLLSKSNNVEIADQYEQVAKLGDLIEDKTTELGSRLNVDFDNICIGPQSIRFNCIPAEKVLVRTLARFSAELEYELATSVRILAPVPGERAVGVEVPNSLRRTVMSGDVISHARNPLLIPLGISPDNKIVTVKINDMPHLLIGGQTGAGKSVMLSHIISSLLMVSDPDDVLFCLIDTKRVTLTKFEGIPNLLCKVIDDAYEAINVFDALVIAMEERYALAQIMKADSLEELNSKLSTQHKLPYIVVVVDEIADLMFISKHKVEESVVRISQKARAVGIHLCLATQSPRREIISGLLKANLPSRIAFSTSSPLDSRIIIDKNGADKLIRNGDMLFSEQGRSPVRIQSPYISSADIDSIVEHWKEQNHIGPRLSCAA